jgi:hypothetical protein
VKPVRAAQLARVDDAEERVRVGDVEIVFEPDDQGEADVEAWLRSLLRRRGTPDDRKG